jgi:hypothetical protein
LAEPLGSAFTAVDPEAAGFVASMAEPPEEAVEGACMHLKMKSSRLVELISAPDMERHLFVQILLAVTSSVAARAEAAVSAMMTMSARNWRMKFVLLRLSRSSCWFPKWRCYARLKWSPSLGRSGEEALVVGTLVVAANAPIADASPFRIDNHLAE